MVEETTSYKQLKETEECLVLLDREVLQDFLVEMDCQDLRVHVERKDSQVSLEELDQRVTKEIQVSPVPCSFTMEVMPEVLKVTVGILAQLDPPVTLGIWACMDLLVHQG